MLDPRSLRLMVVTSAAFDRVGGHRELAEAALRGGATAIQLRAPELPDDELTPIAAVLAERCLAAGVLFIVNDRLEAALSCGADGVHLGQSDEPGRARERLGPGPVLGISVATVREAEAAAGMGADYLGVTVWATPTKPGASGVGPEGLHVIAGATDLPVVGIGGIDRTNLTQVFEAGASGIAVISAVAAAPDSEAATRELRARIDQREEHDGTANG